MNQSYSATTRAIRVDVEPTYEADHSNPARGRWVWSYAVCITNEGQANVQLRERTWDIADANGAVEHVHGPGVVGQEPVLQAGETYRYTSNCPLRTPSGFMSGFYTFQDETGARFAVAVPTFSLDLPDARPALN